jgi:hypothetical protein
MTREMRAGKYQTGLVLANGGWLTYQHVVCLSSRPGKLSYPEKNPLPDVLDEAYPDLEEEAEGEAIIEVS